jgi:hypothetical protein
MTPRRNAMNELNARFGKLQHTGTLGEVFHRVRQAVESLDGLHQNNDPTQTREAHVARVGRAAQQLQGKLESFRDSLGRAYSAASGKLSQEAVDRLGMKESRYAEEIRRRVIAMSPSERTQFATDLASDPEAGSIIAALTSAPAILHGIDREILRAVETQFISNHAPDIVEAQSSLDDAMDLASAALRTAGAMAVEFQDRRELDRITQAQQQAKLAQDQMNAALA